MKELILGGARSGKSRIAEDRAQASGLNLLYVATGQSLDGEMAERIELHRRRRGAEWTLIEEPISLADHLLEQASEENCILVDCLTLWLSNCLFSEHKNCWERQRRKLLTVLPQLPGHIILVSNEVGMGVVPMGATTRRFVDESGRMHQSLAQLCDRVTWTVAGLPQLLKGSAPL